MPSFGKLFQYLKKPTSLILLVLLLLSLVIVFTLLSQSEGLIYQHLFYTSTHDNPIPKSSVHYTLSEAASKIAQNNTLIISTVSEPFLPLFNNWLISITKHNHQNKVLVIAEDYPSLLKVNKIWPGHAVFLSPAFKNNSNSNNQTAYDFGSKGFRKLTDKRVQYILQILELGYNVMFNDVDMVWLADPFPYMKGEYDVYFTDDRPDVKPLNHSHNLPPKAIDGTTYVCACMIYARPTNGSKMLMKRWIEEINDHGTVINDFDQLAFNRALNKVHGLGQVNLYLLPQIGFPPGGLYFWNRDWAKKNEGKQVIIHANYIVGLKEKIQRLRDYGLWFVD